MQLITVLCDVTRETDGTTIQKHSLFFSDLDGRDALCQVDGASGHVMCTGPYPTPPGVPERSPLDLSRVRVDAEAAVDAAGASVGSTVADRRAPDLLIGALLQSGDEGPVWEISFDVWLDTGPVTDQTVRLDASTGAILEHRILGERRG
ncbi:MAG: PepSY domain-containing protein [Gemmatimonadetes bacterium]|nr:PepSY domain-containing protein [Gemmatimonadota bacterium]NIR78145.1 PepSY domain-containing protein [Gemmatimonadota bacterium]NIT86712.1 PepSY domain-containing protein [Gemmatimonadota bacterium]NIU30569.1 PepSY domain-containing protein [Gemmatimonadota bacterium]NIV60935.1 hypothetical protein [Gemmatimonadota bacterium]